MNYWTKVLIALFIVAGVFVFLAFVVFQESNGLLLALAAVLVGCLLLVFRDLSIFAISEPDAEEEQVSRPEGAPKPTEPNDG